VSRWASAGARPAGEAVPGHHRRVEDVRARQELAEGQQLHELLLRQPALALDEGPAGPELQTAEGRQADPGAGEEEGLGTDVWPV
jgi:hypothetical protein